MKASSIILLALHFQLQVNLDFFYFQLSTGTTTNRAIISRRKRRVSFLYKIDITLNKVNVRKMDFLRFGSVGVAKVEC